MAHKLDIGGGGSGQALASWREYLGAVQSLAEIKGVATMMPEVKTWDITQDSRATPPAIEMYSLLGPFLRLSTFPDAFVSSSWRGRERG